MILAAENTALYSHLTALLGFAVLSVLLSLSSHGNMLGRRLIFACSATAVWALSISISEGLFPLRPLVLNGLEALRSLAWCYFLLGTLRSDLSESEPPVPNYLANLSILVVLINTVALPLMISPDSRLYQSALEIQLITWVALAISGLLLTEQVFRNLTTDQRWGFKYLCLGIGCLFIYDFILYSNALLFKTLDQGLWQSRGFLSALTAPLIAVSVARNKDLNIDIHVSRDAVFHSVTLMAGGIYLLLMAGAGYYLKLYGGDWGDLLQIVFLSGALLLLVVLMFSESIRKRLRVFLSKHFFSFKYDYREEWLRFTQHLADPDDTVLNRICHSIAEIVHSSGASIWWKNTHGQYEHINSWGWNGPGSQKAFDPNSLESLHNFLTDSNWVIDVNEFNQDPDTYANLSLPLWLREYPAVWLLVPLTIEQKVIGFLVVKDSTHVKSLNWEDHDLLKMAGQQAAILLAQHQSEQALIEARQFEAFNRLSAYTMHDLKNILAQQSLIVANSEKHRNNPAFIDDVLKTVENSVARMTRLLEQMRRGERNLKISTIEPAKLLAECTEHYSNRQPTPSLTIDGDLPQIEADHDRLCTVIGHLIQNAQEATPADGLLTIKGSSNEQGLLIEVTDTGSGMDADFIKNRLFKPFDSTKGLTGMGIGAFESRNYIRSLGGDINVTSTPGEGSCFQITLPA